MIPLAFLQDDKWIEYCKAMMPGAPCKIPPGTNPTFMLVTFIFVIFGVWIAFTAIHHAITRLRISTAEEFAEANERLIAGIQLLTEFKGRSLRIHCHLLSGDLIQVTRYAERHVSNCLHKYYRIPNERKRFAKLFNFLNENRILRTNAVFITILYFTPFLTRLLLSETKSAMDFYSTRWLPMLRSYAIEFPDC
jgi:hypothetical protein